MSKEIQIFYLNLIHTQLVENETHPQKKHIRHNEK